MKSITIIENNSPFLIDTIECAVFGNSQNSTLGIFRNLATFSSVGRNSSRSPTITREEIVILLISSPKNSDRSNHKKESCRSKVFQYSGSSSEECSNELQCLAKLLEI